jgi:hypothetical protein
VPDLDTDLRRSRDELFDEIRQPPLATVRRRARVLRRRRAAVRSAGVAAAVAAVAVAVLPTVGRDGPPPVAGPTPTSPATVYRDHGITINGLSAIPLQIQGNLGDVEFVDQTNGYVLSGCDASRCQGVAHSSDGGATWTEGTLPPGASGRLDLVGFPGGGILLASGDGATFATGDGGATWRRLPDRSSAPVVAVTQQQIMRYDGPRAIAVWSPGEGRIGPLDRLPGLGEIQWVAPARAGDGAWWVGGTAAGAPALAVSRDGGATWGLRPLGTVAGAVRSVSVSTLGSEAYAVVTGDDSALLGIYHSTDSGATFGRTRAGGVADPATVAGAVVPLLDGRLLAVSPGADDPEEGDFWVSADNGRTFTELDLPVVGRIDRTVAGWVAHDFFRDYAAFSRDGATWRKLEVW